ncbi:MAG: APC family permease [Enterobacteriaceae bacterium]
MTQKADDAILITTSVTTVGKKIKVLGLVSLLAVSVGLVVSQGVMVLMLHGAGIAGIGFLIPLTLAWLMALSYACSFSELALMIPRAGSLSTYTEVTIGHFPAILATFSGYIVVAMFALSAEVLLLDLIVNMVYPNNLPPLSIAFAVLGLFTVLNLFNIDIFARLQTLLAVVMVIVLLLLGLNAISSEQAQPVSTLLTSDVQGIGLGLLALSAMAIWGFVGAEFVCPLVEEARQPARDIPRAMLIGVTVIFITIALYSVGALLVLPRAALVENPLPHYLYATKVFGEAGQFLLVVAAITATCSTLNSSLATIPRMLSGMAENGQAFPVFKIHSKKARVPWPAVLFIAGITGLPILLIGENSISLLLSSAAIAWLLAYIIAHINVIVLRRRYPHMARPFRTPFYPVPQLFGIAGMIYAIVHVAPDAEQSLTIFMTAGAVLGLISLVAIIWIKFIMRKPLFKPEPIEWAIAADTH